VRQLKPSLRSIYIQPFPLSFFSLRLWLQLRFDNDTTTIRLRRIARACFQFDASKKWTCQLFVVVVS